MSALQTNEESQTDTLLSILLQEKDATRSSIELLPFAENRDVVAKPSLNDVFKSATTFNEAVKKSMDDLRATEHSLFGKTFSEYPRELELDDIATSAVRFLIGKAEKQFAPQNGSLSIDTSFELDAIGFQDYREDHRSRRYREALKPGQYPLDLDRLWKHLENKFGGDAGEILGYQQLASVIVSQFDLEDESKIKRTATGVILKRRVYASKKEYGATKGMYELGYSWRDDMEKLFRALSCFAEWAEMDNLARNLHPNMHAVCRHDFVYSSRDTHQFDGINLAMFSDKWEFKLSHQVAQKLMLFLGEFSST